MKELLEYIAKSLVDYPADVVVTETENGNTTVLELKVNESDMGKVIPAAESGIANPSRYRTRSIPSAGAILKPEDAPEKQISFPL